MNHCIKTINLGIDRDFIISKLNKRASRATSELSRCAKELEQKGESMQSLSKMYLIFGAANIAMSVLTTEIVYILFSIYFFWRYYNCRKEAHEINIGVSLSAINSNIVDACSSIYQEMELDELFELDDIEKVIPEMLTIKQLWGCEIESIELDGDALSYTIDGLPYTVSPVTVRDGELNCITLLSGGIFIGDQKNVKVQTEQKEVSIPVKIKECDCE